MGYANLLVERETNESGTVLVLTLNRPEVRNAIDRALLVDLGHALDEAQADPSVRALVLTGAGGRAFAAGADIAELEQRGAADALERINSRPFRRLEDLPVPTIAAIRGYALGGGCELAMACDLRIAGEGAKLGQPEVGLGIIPGAGAMVRLPKLVGLGVAKELIYTGRIIDAAEALRIGLVNRVVPDERVLEEAKAVAWTIAKQGPLAVRLAKEVLNASGRTNAAWDTLDAVAQAVLFESEDKHRRMSAFLAQRGKGKREA